MIKKAPRIHRKSDGIWERFERVKSSRSAIAGKYLFFSADRDALVEIAISELKSGRFWRAKIPAEGNRLGVSAQVQPRIQRKGARAQRRKKAKME